MSKRFILKSDLIDRIHKLVKLFFFRKNFKGSKSEQAERVERFISSYLKFYDFKCDLIAINFRKKGIRIKLKNLKRYKSRERLDFLSKFDFLEGGKL